MTLQQFLKVCHIVPEKAWSDPCAGRSPGRVGLSGLAGPGFGIWLDSRSAAVGGGTLRRRHACHLVPSDRQKVAEPSCSVTWRGSDQNGMSSCPCVGLRTPTQSRAASFSAAVQRLNLSSRQDDFGCTMAVERSVVSEQGL